AKPAENAPAPAEDEARIQAEKEYARQMEEYNRQMEEYNRQMEELRRRQEEEHRREEEERRKAEEEEARKRAEEEARRRAEEEEAARKAAEMARKEAELKRLEAEAKRLEAEALQKELEAMGGAAPAQSAPAPKPESSPAPKPAPKSASPLRAGILPAARGPLGKAPSPARNGGGQTPAPANALRARTGSPALPKARPAGGAASLPRPAEKPADAPAGGGEPAPEEGGDDEARRAYLEKLQARAQKPPIYKNKAVMCMVGFLVVLVAGLSVYVLNKRAADEKERQRREEVNALLKVSQEINKKGADNLEMARKKGIDLSKASMKNAQILFRAILRPSEFDQNGNAVAQNAALFLGIMAEMNPEIRKWLLDEMTKHADTILPQHFNWMLQRLAVTNIESLKQKLLKMSDTIAKKPKFANQAKAVQSIWDVLVLHVDTSDVPRILELMKNPKTDEGLTKSLANNLLHIVAEVETDPRKKQEIGDRIFESVPEKRRGLAGDALSCSASPKALDFYKKELKDPKKWAIVMPRLGMWGDDSACDFLLQQYEEAKKADAGKPQLRLTDHVTAAIRNTINKDRDYPLGKVDRMIAVTFDKINENTADYAALIDKTDEASAHFIGKNHPDYKKSMERLNAIQASRRQKVGLAKMLSTKRAFPWVTAWLGRLAKDPDQDLQIEVKNARRKVDENTKKDPIGQ
ncbi:MAG: hypothetical protein LUG84_00435, partial [Akkermansiaceae bacterium]|nr:hypothetical protein [Akkermansiaceae bacterium]